MPIRREGNECHHISDWDSWIEKEIRDARERGEFDNLPTQGKPIDIHSTNVDSQWDFAFSRLKNANAVPEWMELERACHMQRAEMDAFLERSARYLADQLALLEHQVERPPAPAPVPRWKFWKHLASWLQLPTETKEAPLLDRLDLIRIRAKMLEQYLDRAAALDKQIVAFNYSLSRNMMHLERMRMLPDRARRLFDAGCPPIR